jgi:uncharacterized protein
MPQTKNNRIVILDSLRGFALLGIVLIHSVEHFDFFREPEINFFFSAATDRFVMDMVFLFISGKAYSIFALLFGLSYFIQINRHEQKGVDYRGRFLWRLTILMLFGFIHSLIYKGDILHIYAILGIPLLFIYKLSIRNLLFIALLLALQLPIIFKLIYSFITPAYQYAETFGSGFWREGTETYAGGGLWEVIKFNIWKGRSEVWGWMYYNGRHLQLLALFILGLVAGKKRLFENLQAHKKFILQIWTGSIVAALLLYLSSHFIQSLALSPSQLLLSGKLLKSYSDLAYTSLIIFSVIMIYQRFKNASFFSLSAAYGRMSLSNYLFQAIFGVIFFFNFGFGMYRYMGSAWSLLYGIIFFSMQLLISKVWLNHFHYGPLEWQWRALTFMNFNIPMKKKAE